MNNNDPLTRFCLLPMMINRRKPQYKKHRTWDGDAVLVLNGAKGTLYDLEGKLYALISRHYGPLNVHSHSIGAGSLKDMKVEEGGEYEFSGREIGIRSFHFKRELFVWKVFWSWLHCKFHRSFPFFCHETISSLETFHLCYSLQGTHELEARGFAACQFDLRATVR
ncbi:hypothetical protein JVU11DRAFT_2463 [Chiua virens]|nr:hypothetical protein JVU11DRAFT_2463 [Chiua virens]